MLDINGILNFGKRISNKKSSLSSEDWNYFVKKYFYGNFEGIEKFIFLSEYPLITQAEFDRNPQLSLNGIYRAVKNHPVVKGG